MYLPGRQKIGEYDVRTFEAIGSVMCCFPQSWRESYNKYVQRLKLWKAIKDKENDLDEKYVQEGLRLRNMSFLMTKEEIDAASKDKSNTSAAIASKISEGTRKTVTLILLTIVPILINFASSTVKGDILSFDKSLACSMTFTNVSSAPTNSIPCDSIPTIDPFANDAYKRDQMLFVQGAIPTAITTAGVCAVSTDATFSYETSKRGGADIGFFLLFFCYMLYISVGKMGEKALQLYSIEKHSRLMAPKGINRFTSNVHNIFALAYLAMYLIITSRDEKVTGICGLYNVYYTSAYDLISRLTVGITVAYMMKEAGGALIETVEPNYEWIAADVDTFLTDRKAHPAYERIYELMGNSTPWTKDEALDSYTQWYGAFIDELIIEAFNSNQMSQEQEKQSDPSNMEHGVEMGPMDYHQPNAIPESSKAI